MKLLDVSTPGIRKKRVLNVLSSGWMAVVRWITSGGLLHEGGQTKPEQQGSRDDLMVVSMSNAAVSGTGRRLRNALPPCGQMTWHCFYGGLRSAEEPAFSSSFACCAWGGGVGLRPRERTIVALMCSQRVRFRVPAGCQRSNAGNGRGDPVQCCPGTDQQFFVRVPGRVLQTGYLLYLLYLLLFDCL